MTTMKAPKQTKMQTRREFLAYTGCLGALIGLGAGRLFSSGQTESPTRPHDEVKDDIWDLGEVNAAETAALLSNKVDTEMERVLKGKLQRIGGGDDLPYIARNLRLVLKARAVI